MGRIQAMEMAEMMDVESAIAWHLQSNHYPPVPASMVQVCIEAIDSVNNGGPLTGWHKLLDLPEGVTYRGMTKAPVHAIIEQHHLDAWVELDEEFDEDEL